MKRALAIPAALWLLLSGTAGAQSTSKAASRQSMEITVTSYVVDASGEPLVMPKQTIRYKLARVRTEAGWKTTMTFGGPDGISAQEASRNPFFGGRAEFDESGTVSLFDKQGNNVPFAAGTALPPLPMMMADWPPALHGVNTDPTSLRARLKELETKYTKQPNKVRGLAQYLRRDGADAEELLVDETLGLPVEMNVIQSNQLKGHVDFSYVEEAGRKIRRNATRSEFVVNEEGDRAVTVAEYSNVLVEGGN